MQITLRERDFDALRAELVPDSQEYIAFHVGDAILGIVDPNTKLEIDPAVAEALDQTFPIATTAASCARGRFLPRGSSC